MMMTTVKEVDMSVKLPPRKKLFVEDAAVGNDDDGVALAYDPNFLDVYLNGVRLVNGATNDYTATDGSTITLSSGASAGDILNIVQDDRVYFYDNGTGFDTKRLVGPFPPELEGDTINIYMKVIWEQDNYWIEKDFTEKFIVE